MKTTHFIAILLIALIWGCKKEKDTPCEQTEQHYYLPDSLNGWYADIVPPSDEYRNFFCKSNTGLTETMKVTAHREGATTVHDECLVTYFHSYYFEYQSSLYGNRFSLKAEFEDNRWYPNGWDDTADDNVHPDKINFGIKYSFRQAGEMLPYFVDLRQPLIPHKKNVLKANYFSHNHLPAVTTYLTCDSCITYLGSITQNGNVYDNVYRYKVPINLGNGEAYSEFLINQKNGIIQFKRKDNSVWTIDPF